MKILNLFGSKEEKKDSNEYICKRFLEILNDIDPDPRTALEACIAITCLAKYVFLESYEKNKEIKSAKERKKVREIESFFKSLDSIKKSLNIEFIEKN